MRSIAIKKSYILVSLVEWVKIKTFNKSKIRLKIVFFLGKKHIVYYNTPSMVTTRDVEPMRNAFIRDI